MYNINYIQARILKESNLKIHICLYRIYIYQIYFEEKEFFLKDMFFPNNTGIPIGFNLQKL